MGIRSSRNGVIREPESLLKGRSIGPRGNRSKKIPTLPGSRNGPLPRSSPKVIEKLSGLLCCLWVIVRAIRVTSPHYTIDRCGDLGSVAGMARPLRIERAGGWYHITGRGNERRLIYRDD